MLTDENKENRKKGIGASEAAIVMGLCSYMSPYELWLIKTGRAEARDISELPQVEWGTIHEETIAQHYAKKTGCKVRKVTNTLYHKDYPFMLCHLDRKVEGQSKVLECKFAMYANENWGETGSDHVPLPYIIQVQHQLAVTGYQEADLAVLISGFDFRVYPLERDEVLIKKIIEDVEAFWKCVETDTPPPLRDKKDASLAYPMNVGNLKVAEPEIEFAVIEYNHILKKENEIDKEKKKIQNLLSLYIQDADGVRNESQVLATWKANKNGVRSLRVSEVKR